MSMVNGLFNTIPPTFSVHIFAAKDQYINFLAALIELMINLFFIRNHQYWLRFVNHLLSIKD